VTSQHTCHSDPQKIVKLSLGLTEHQEDVQGSGDIVPCILFLAIDGVRGLLHSLNIYSNGKRPPVSTGKKAGWFQSQSGWWGEEQHLGH
jgi:hypothetical protein